MGFCLRDEFSREGEREREEEIISESALFLGKSKPYLSGCHLQSVLVAMMIPRKTEYCNPCKSKEKTMYYNGLATIKTLTD